MVSGNGTDGRGKRLKSWKEIATFFGTDERTVRRWQERGLPVRRVPGGVRPTIYADVAELEAWLAGKRDDGPAAAVAPAAAHSRRVALFAGLGALLLAGGGAILFSAAPFSAGRSARHQPSQQAADLYLAGTYNLERRTPESLRSAVALFGRAIAEDPAYAEAYGGLADTYLLLREYSNMPDREAYARAREAAAHALAIDERLASAHAALAFVTFYWDGDWEPGLREFERAIELDPTSASARHWFATSLCHAGRIDRALASINEAQRRDPSSRSILADKGLILFYAGRRDEAVSLLQQLAAGEPDFKSSHAYLAIIFLADGEDQAYLHEAGITARLMHDADQTAVADAAAEGFRRDGRRGMLDAMLATRLRIRRAGRGTEYEVAAAYAGLGESEPALRHLAAALASNESAIASLRVDPRFRPLHRAPAFRSLAARVGTGPRRA